MSLLQVIKDKIIADIPDAQVKIVDDSEKHRGHAGYREEGESHFRVTVVSGVFDSMSRIERQKLIYKILEEEMKGLIHALSIRAVTPEK